MSRSGREEVVVYPEIKTTDRDGNPHTRPDSVGITTSATVHPMGFSGTAARRAEMDNEGHLSEQVCVIYFPREDDSISHPLGPQSAVVWKGEKWQLFGHGKQFNGSRRTRHISYQMKRS
ncbi:hypothetical protein HUN08_12605 [Gordonia sp. X0973]|nr:hypothetical protein HUN08_12605 [Gordonia sp. X0973]